MNINLSSGKSKAKPEPAPADPIKPGGPGVMFALMTWWKRRQIRLNYGPGFSLVIARDYKPSSGGKNWWTCKLLDPNGIVVASDYSPAPGGKWTAAWDCMNKYTWSHPATQTRNTSQAKQRRIGV